MDTYDNVNDTIAGWNGAVSLSMLLSLPMSKAAELPIPQEGVQRCLCEKSHDAAMALALAIKSDVRDKFFFFVGTLVNKLEH